jgi:hypothetical protein
VNTTSAQSPAQGDVFAIPLANGKFGAAVLIEAGREFRFVVLDGFWGSLPTYEEASSMDVMSMYETGRDEVFKGWFRAPFPESFVLLGRVSLETNELQTYLNPSGTMVFGTGARFAQTLLERWRWRFDREALVAEMERRRVAYEKKERKRRENRSLKTMLRERPFAHWAEQWPRSAVNNAHRIVREAARELIALEGAPDAKAQRIAVLKRIVDDFNGLYDRTGCIETQEAGEIVDWVEQLASRVGLSNENEELTGHRRW